ncbi:lactococcin 972 family bacteriocin [Streptomyces sp. NPDC023588]|uniref:lactococcin 972 family bacteriocin n=1 Tax=Streptomyces sp. NPDC023588 TaxID=3154907 RepID=UPI0033FBF7F3
MQIKRGMKTALAAGVLVAAVATPAMADNVSGGIWNYGVSDGKVYSNYYHPDKCHGSSVQGAYYASSGNAPSGTWALASAAKAVSGNKSYYRSTC